MLSLLLLLQDPIWVTPTVSELGLIVLSYLLGAIPFGLVLARVVKGVDLREVGSGNIGATNAMRVMGKPLGLLVFLLDAAKGALVILFLVPLVARPEAEIQTAVGAGIAAVLGHCFPVFLSFRGGKGVATGCGALATFNPWIFVAGGLVWIVVLAVFRWVALASICMGLAFPVAAWLLGAEPLVIVGAGLLSVLILARHRSNMERMLAGTEPKAFTKQHAVSTSGTQGDRQR